MYVLGDGGGDGDRGCIAFDTQAILLDSECISAITLPECLRQCRRRRGDYATTCTSIATTQAVSDIIAVNYTYANA